VLLLDLVVAAHLLDDQLRVADQIELVGAQLPRQLDPEQDGPVLGDVVGRLADRLAALGEDLAGWIGGDGRDRGRPRVATRAAVDVDDDLFQARTSSSERASEITFWARCAGISSCRANSIV
jgi:hypothetical protein